MTSNARADVSPFWRAQWRRFLSRRAPLARELVLSQREIFLLPSREGWLFGVIVVVMLLSALNYANGLAFALAFLSAASALVAVLETQRNLLGLAVRAGASRDGFAGGEVQFEVFLVNPAKRARRNVRVWLGDAVVARVDVPPEGQVGITLSSRPGQRGRVAAPVFALDSTFGLGLVRAFTRRVRFAATALAYPAPAGEALPVAASGEGDGVLAGHGGDEFAGLRAYRPGDPLTRVSFKALARGHGLLTKEFEAPSAAEHWYDYDALAPRPMEARLSILCRLVVDAAEAGLRYGLRLPGQNLAPSTGPEHRARCLAALALFGSAP